MNTQAYFDEEIYDYLPRVKKVIEAAPSFEANQMRCKAKQMCINTKISLGNQSEGQLMNTEQHIIETFLYYGWINE